MRFWIVTKESGLILAAPENTNCLVLLLNQLIKDINQRRFMVRIACTDNTWSSKSQEYLDLFETLTRTIFFYATLCTKLCCGNPGFTARDDVVCNGQL